MILNRIESALMNNPLRAMLQKYFEAWLLEMRGGAVTNGHTLEIGCGRGIGIEIILERFGAASVDAFDLDPKMVDLAKKRHRNKSCVNIWKGDATSIPVSDYTYDAVFDFAIIHHVPDWRKTLSEVNRVLKPGGRFYADEAFSALICNPLLRFLDHPREDRFNYQQFKTGLSEAGLHIIASGQVMSSFGYFIAEK